MVINVVLQRRIGTTFYSNYIQTKGYQIKQVEFQYFVFLNADVLCGVFIQNFLIHTVVQQV